MVHNEVIADTSSGRVRGYREHGLDVFAGIPYAAPPVGALRWRATRPHEPWSGIRDARAFGASAPQPFDPTGRGDGILGDHGRPPFDEDCLTLNVWTPGRSGGRRPVLVWIHGGGFLTGSGTLPVYHGDTFAASGDLVVVTLNYRLGALGFFAHEPGAEANFWLTDQIAALRWIHENAEAFGGDPARITVAGESGGAFSALSLAVNPLTRDLVRRVILQSPPLGLHLATPEEAAATSAAVADILDAPDAAALQDVPADALVGATLALFPRAARFGHWSTPFVPILDGNTLAEHPLDGFLRGAAPDVEVLAGWNADEASFAFALRPELRQLDRGPVVDRFSERFGAEAEAAWAASEQGRPGGLSPADALTALVSDELFIQPVLELAESRRGGRPVWAYEFAFPSPAHDGVLGATHCLELPFTFANLDRWGHAPFVSGIDRAASEPVSRVMHEAWIAFARGGPPVANGLPAWLPYGEGRETMIFDATPALAEDPLGCRRVLHEQPGPLLRRRTRAAQAHGDRAIRENA